jgi:hypothetical protein
MEDARDGMSALQNDQDTMKDVDEDERDGVSYGSGDEPP